MYNKAVEFIKSKINDFKPRALLILGSGLGNFSKQLENAVSISYDEIPGFRKTGAPGHRGELIFGYINGNPLACMSGRFHYYEGYSGEEIVFPVRVLRKLGAEILIVTNAAGGINSSFKIGDIMIITDHINLQGRNPLIGANNDSFGSRFFDMSSTYSKRLIAGFKEAAAEIDVCVKEGVYIAVCGPNFETPAEIRAFGTLGADAVGMSTVPEVLAGAHCGMEIFGVSLITNMAAGISKEALSGDDVIKTGEASEKIFTELMRGLIKRI